MDKIIHYLQIDTVTSTQSWAKENLSLFDLTSITCITANSQTQGRGRYDHSWISPIGGLYATYVIPSLPSSVIINLAQIICYSLAKVLLKENLSPQLKWPNDLLLSNKKLAGALVETTTHEKKQVALVGIGINVLTTEKELSKITPPATSLKIESKKEQNIQDLLHDLSDQFLQDLELLKREGFSPFYDLYNTLLYKKDELVKYTDGQEIFLGYNRGIDKQGRLIIEQESKKAITLSSAQSLPI